MRVGRARISGIGRTVLIEGGEDALRAAVLPPDAPSVDDIIRDPEAAQAARESRRHAMLAAVEDLELRAPLTRFDRDVLCTGWNYWDHFEESHGKREGQDPKERPRHPTFFTKAPGCLIGPFDPIAYDPTVSSKWDYEAELAIVIGRAGRSIPEDRARQHIAGVLVANDVSQRDLQRAHGGQWLKGKSIDRCSPIGPWITTLDDISDIQNLDILLELNGTVMQSANTSQMAFPIDRLVAELSFGMTLRPGDLILTGTPAGIGNAREPQVFLREGDLVETRITGVGTLRNTVRIADLAGYSDAGECG